MHRYRTLLFVLISLLFIKCNSFFGNTIREYNDKCYVFDTNKMSIFSQCKHNEYKIKDVKVILIDSVSKKYKRVILYSELPAILTTYSLNMPDTTKESVVKELVLVILTTERDKTWYDISITPTDWKNGKPKYFIKNVW